MQRNFFFLLFLTVFINTHAQPTVFEQSGGKRSATYQQTIDFYRQLDERYNTIKMADAGPTDAAPHLNVVYYNADKVFSRDEENMGKVVILINNGIHPGEPDGIDACMMLLRDAAEGKIKVPSNIIIAVIPVYNIGGALNRNSTTRANQNGPEKYGFRGNGQNLDLNRDFIKADAKETLSLERLFRELDPDIFIDNHVSDGADYQHIVTLLSTQHDKLGGHVGAFMHDTFEPELYKDMKGMGYDLVPYVNDFDKTPDHGWTEFYEPPRFSSGYAALFQTMAFVPETHMLKPYKDRVWATYNLMQSFIKIASSRAAEIHVARNHDKHALQQQIQFPLAWHADTTRYDTLAFKGYEAGYKKSEVSGLQRLYYDHSKPYTKQVRFYNHYLPEHQVTAPEAYIVPHAWGEVIKRLKCNGIEMQQFDEDTAISVTTYHIDNYETSPKPYEKHYLHKNVQVTQRNEHIRMLKGDYIITLNQQGKRYLVETLEPTAPDGFFAWNFFDGILQQKEYFSDYVFEDEAAKILQQDPALKTQLEDKRKRDPAFVKDAAAQLDFVYRHSAHLEPSFMRYPVYRIEK